MLNRETISGDTSMITARRAIPILPLLIWTALAAADEPSTAPALRVSKALSSGEATRIVCFGDSVTGVYYHTGGRRAYTDMLGIALRRLYAKADVTMINAGISGHTTANGLSRIDSDVIRHKPALVTVMFGLNDMARVPLETYRENLRTIIRKCRAVGAEVLLATPNNVIDTASRPTEKLITYCEVVRQVGRELDVPVCDCYRELESLRQHDALAWRLLMSDEIHPNMDGHKRIAEQLARSISGRVTSLADVPAPGPTLARTSSLLTSGKPIKILAMPPLDATIAGALKVVAPDARLEIIPWPVAGASLAAIEQDARARVRPLKPDLVLLAVPRGAEANSAESFIRSYSWIMNWSLSFSTQEWDVVVVHPSVVDLADVGSKRDSLVRQLVAAQDLTLIDRRASDDRPADRILVEWMEKELISKKKGTNR